MRRPEERVAGHSAEEAGDARQRDPRHVADPALQQHRHRDRRDEHRRPQRPLRQRHDRAWRRQPDQRLDQLPADGDPERDREKHREGASEPCRTGDEVPRRELGHRDRQREAGDDDDQAGEGGHRRRHAEPERRRHERGGRDQRRRDQLEEPLLQAQAAGSEPEQADQDAEPRRHHDVAGAAAEEAARRAGRPARGNRLEQPRERRRLLLDRLDAGQRLGRRQRSVDDGAGVAVDVGELAEAEAARLDARQEGALRRIRCRTPRRSTSASRRNGRPARAASTPSPAPARAPARRSRRRAARARAAARSRSPDPRLRAWRVARRRDARPSPVRLPAASRSDRRSAASGRRSRTDT